MGIKQFHLVCTLIISCLLSIWGKYSENSLGTVVILPLTCSGHLQLHVRFWPETSNNQFGQNGYQTAPFSVYIHNVMFIFHLGYKYFENSMGTIVILPFSYSGHIQLTFSDLKQVILDQVRQKWMCMKQFHLVCTFTIWCLFSFWGKYPENSLGTVVI